MDVPSYLLGKKAGGGGTTDYQALSNKPSINGVILSGDKTAEDLGLTSEIHYIDDNSEQNPFIFDNHELGIYYFKHQNVVSYDNTKMFFYCKGDNSSSQTTISLKGNSYIQIVKKYSETATNEIFAIGNPGYYIEQGKFKDRITVYAKTSNNSIGTSTLNQSNSWAIANVEMPDYASTISAKKTFTVLPESSVVPTTDEQLVNKKYVDDNAGGGASYTAGTNIEITNDNVINNTIPYNKTARSGSVFLGDFTFSNNYAGVNSVIIGNNYYGNQTSENNVFIGRGTSIYRIVNDTVILGDGASSYSSDTVIIGKGASNNPNCNGSIAIGKNAIATEANQAIFGSSNIPINKIDIYTSNGIKTLATTDYLTTITGYDATKTQVLKNVNGTFTWVDE